MVDLRCGRRRRGCHQAIGAHRLTGRTRGRLAVGTRRAGRFLGRSRIAG
ncbi:hypothetical protein [Limosilactobacillus reuteri]|nr:hypothetical protein [Limosilactobacillus reuteri]